MLENQQTVLPYYYINNFLYSLLFIFYDLCFIISLLRNKLKEIIF